MYSILITGANGLVGRELAGILAEKHNVHALVRRLPDDPIKKVNYIIADLSKKLDTTVFPRSMDVVIHLAQSENFRNFPEMAEEIFSVNAASTLSLLDYSREVKAKKFIYASSGGIYGNSDEGFDENQPVIPNKDLGFYLGTKLCSEIAVESFSEVFNTIILRFFFVYGKHQRKNMLIPRLLENIKNRNPITLQGKNGITINPIHVSDAALAISNAIELKGSHKINIAGSENLSLKQICEQIGIKTGKEVKYVFLDQEPKNLIGDTKKMNKLLLTARVSFNKGLEDLL